MKLKRLKHNFIAVEILEQDETTPGGIVVPQTVEQNVRKGKVLAVGPGRWDSGVFIETCVEVGEVVLFSRFIQDTMINIDGKPVFLFRDLEVFGTVEE